MKTPNIYIKTVGIFCAVNLIFCQWQSKPGRMTYITCIIFMLGLVYSTINMLYSRVKLIITFIAVNMSASLISTYLQNGF